MSTILAFMSSFAGALRVPLVGRKDELKEIHDAVGDQSAAYVVYIVGPGGIGKTRLLESVLKRLRESNKNLVIAPELVDLYHTSNQTPEGLMETIHQQITVALSKDPEQAFPQYSAAHKDLAQQRNVGLRPPAEMRQKLGKAFLADMQALTSQKRLILAIDTTEKLRPQKDLVAEELGISEEDDVFSWVINTFLPNLKNGVILLAGRTKDNADLSKELTNLCDNHDNKFVPIQLHGLSEQETLAYFEKVVSQLQKSKQEEDRDAATFLKQLTEKRRKSVFHALRNEGEQARVRPILLALAIEIIRISGQIPAFLTLPLTKAKALTDDKRAENRKELCRTVVREIKNRRSPLDKLIIALGWLRKGATIELLAKVSGVAKEEVEAKQSRLQELSFIKKRPKDDRLFLHDEMYSLLDEYALKRAPGPQRERIYRIVQTYYRYLEKDLRQEMSDVYKEEQSKEETTGEDLQKTRQKYYDILVDDLHYRLEKDVNEGFETYFRYAEQATTGDFDELDLLLRSELLEFLKHFQGSNDFIKRVKADAAIRWLKRSYADGDKQQAKKIINQLTGGAKDLIGEAGPLAKHEFIVWKALVETEFEKALQEAAKQLDTSIAELKNMPADQRSPQWSAVMARAYNNRGYVARMLGHIEVAIDNYQKTLPHWRQQVMEVEQANTLNNLSFALSKKGEIAIGRRLAKDALTLRKTRGPGVPVVLSFSTLAEIEILAGNHLEAQTYATDALKLSKQMGHKQGQVLALLALAQSTRYFADPEAKEDKEERIQLLEKSVDNCKQVLEMAEEIKPEESIRARYEKAASLREICRLKKESGEDYDTEQKKAEELFKQLLEETAAAKLWHRYFDIRMGKAWMVYYLQDDSGKIEKELQNIRIAMDTLEEDYKTYKISKTHWPLVSEISEISIVGQFARYHVLKGVLALDQKKFTEVGKQFTLAFAYDQLIDVNARDVQRGINVVYRRLRALNTKELLEVFESTGHVLGVDLPTKVPGVYEDKTNLLFWKILESHFGDYDTLKELADENTPL